MQVVIVSAIMNKSFKGELSFSLLDKRNLSHNSYISLGKTLNVLSVKCSNNLEIFLIFLSLVGFKKKDLNTLYAYRRAFSYKKTSISLSGKDIFMNGHWLWFFIYIHISLLGRVPPLPSISKCLFEKRVLS